MGVDWMAATLAPWRQMVIEGWNQEPRPFRGRVGASTGDVLRGGFAGGDDAVGKGFADDAVGDGHDVAVGFEFFGRFHFEPADGEVFGGFDAGGVIGAEGGEEAALRWR